MSVDTRCDRKQQAIRLKRLDFGSGERSTGLTFGKSSNASSTPVPVLRFEMRHVPYVCKK